MIRQLALLACPLIAIACGDTSAKQEPLEQMLDAAGQRLDRGEAFSDAETTGIWTACGRHPIEKCVDVMSRLPDPKGSSWASLYVEHFKQMLLQQHHGMQGDGWKDSLLTIVCRSDEPSLHPLCQRLHD